MELHPSCSKVLNIFLLINILFADKFCESYCVIEILHRLVYTCKILSAGGIFYFHIFLINLYALQLNSPSLYHLAYAWRMHKYINVTLISGGLSGETRNFALASWNLELLFRRFNFKEVQRTPLTPIFTFTSFYFRPTTRHHYFFFSTVSFLFLNSSLGLLC